MSVNPSPFRSWLRGAKNTLELSTVTASITFVNTYHSLIIFFKKRRLR
jgi:hypothetical protein